MIKNIFLSLLTLLICSYTADAKSITFASKPSLTPDGSTIYFSYEGDIYTVPVVGGLALKIITMDGTSTSPKVSPDGKLLAFSSNAQGNSNVYIVPVAGGEVVQLTFHDANDVPVGWTADSKTVYFESNRYNNISVYSVPITGGTPVRLFGHYFNTIANFAPNHKTGEFYFNESSESYRFATRKGYKGDHNPNIKSWDPKTKEYKELTTYRGKDIWPMVDKNGILYYVSDESNGEANIVRHNDSKYLTSFKESLQYPSISYDGSKIVFIKDYKINILDVASGKTVAPEIEVADNRIVSDMSVELARPQSFDISPDGKKLAFVFRGSIFVSDAKGGFIKQISTPATERASLVYWAADSKTLYYTRTSGNGWYGLFKQSADTPGAEIKIYTPEASVKSMAISPKRDKIAFVEGDNAITAITLATDKVEKLADNEFWAFHNYNISFSADGKHLAYSAVSQFERDIFLYDFATKKSTNLTHSANSEDNPLFSPDGKNLYMIANRYNASFPRGGGSSQLFKVALDKVAAPFESNEYDKLFGAKGAAKDSSVVVSDPAYMYRRYTQVENSGNQSAPIIEKRGDKTYLLYNSNHEGTMGLYILEVKDWDQKPAQRVKGGITTASTYSSNGKDLFVMDRSSIYKVDPATANATKVDLKHIFTKNISDEFRQMFFEVWATLEENFYDVKFHGVDWNAKRDYYASFLPEVKNRDNLRMLINDMLMELNSSHMGFTTSGREETPPVRYITAETGLLFKNGDPYILDKILPMSSADFSGNPLKPGDELIEVNGIKVDKKMNREIYFVSPVTQKEVALKFKRGTAEVDVKLHPIASGALRTLLYDEWEDNNRAIVDKASNGKVAYLHMRDMSAGALNKFMIEVNTYAVHKEGLILDLRFNNGGNVHHEVLEILSQKQHFNWSFRDQTRASHPNVTMGEKPIVVLINERSLSDAEVTSNGIKTLKLAKLIGTETYRWIIFTSSASMVDGSSLRLPAWGCYTLDGKDLEFEGVAPDVYIKNTFKDRLESKDPQLERALQEFK